jgi:hypothetical protein
MPFRTDRLLEIETQLESLKRENDELKRRLSLSMREDHICPRCEHPEVAHASSILDRSESGREELAVIQPSIWSSKSEGKFEIFVCRSCGFVEWYVKEPELLGRHDKSKDTIRFLSAAKANGCSA